MAIQSTRSQQNSNSQQQQQLKASSSSPSRDQLAAGQGTRIPSSSTTQPNQSSVITTIQQSVENEDPWSIVTKETNSVSASSSGQNKKKVETE